jgi:hypothetical protein
MNVKFVLLQTGRTQWRAFRVLRKISGPKTKEIKGMERIAYEKLHGF